MSGESAPIVSPINQSAPVMKFTYFSATLILILSSFLNISCSKNDAEPLIVDQVSGSYTLIKIVSGPLGVDYPFTEPGTGTKVSGKIEITKVADDKATASLTFIETDKAGKVTEKENSLGDAILQKVATGEIEAYNGTTKIGSYNNGILTLSVNHPTLGPITISGRKN